MANFCDYPLHTKSPGQRIAKPEVEEEQVQENQVAEEVAVPEEGKLEAEVPKEADPEAPEIPGE